MNLFISLAIMVVSYLLSNMSKSKSSQTQAKPALDSDITFPQSEEGTKQIVVFGEAWLPNWSVLWHGNYRAYGLQDHGTTIGYMYSYSMLMGLCYGPIDEVVEIRIGGRTAFRPSDGDGGPNLFDTTAFQIYKPKLFGGTPEGQGGINVKGYFLNGHDNQLLPATLPKMNAQATSDTQVPLAQFMPGEHPAYRGMATMILDGYVSYNNTNPSTWEFLVRRRTAGWDGPTWYPDKATIRVSSGPVIIPNPQLSDPNITDDTKRTLDRTVTVVRDIYGMNPIHVLIEGMTNRDWGRGLSLDEINVASYTDAANIVWDEGLALTTKWDRSGPLSDFMQQVIDYIGAAQYPDPVTGKISIKLIRGDYSVDNIRTFSYTSGIKAVSDNTATTADSSANQIIVTYTSPVTGKRGQIRAQNTALYTALDSVLIQSHTYDCCPNADIAKRLAERDLKALSSGLRRIKLQMDRSAWNIVPGQVIKVVNLTDHKIESMVLRVGKIDKSGGTDGTITLNCMQDVFSLDTTEYAYTIDTQPLWKPPVAGDATVVPAPPLVSNLHLLTPWDGHTFAVGWDRGNDANYYDVQVVVPKIDSKIVRFRTHVMDNTFTYTLDDMIADGGPWRSIEVQVRAVSFTNGAGPWFKLGLYNPQIAALTGIQITEAMKQAFFQCNRPVENDWAGILVYISDKTGFVPGGESLVYDGTDLFVTMATLADGSLLKAGTDYYLRAAGYDNFGKDDLNFSSELVFGVVANAPDANTIVAQMIKDGALEVSKFARSLAVPMLVEAIPNAYAGSDTILNQADNPPKLYRWDPIAKKYVSALDASDIAGEIDPDNLPAISTDKLVGLIPTTQLDGKITANQIAANAIGADQIAAGSVIAGKLAAGAVQAGSLAANAVTAGTIAAGAVGADQIAAKSISGDKLLVGDMTNQLDDPDFSLGDLRSWQGDTTKWKVDSTTNALGSDGGKGALVGMNNGGSARAFQDIANSRWVQVATGDIFYASAQTRLMAADPAAQSHIYIVAYDANKTQIANSAAGYVVNSTTYALVSCQYQVVNPAIKYLRVLLRAWNNGGALTSTFWVFDNVQFLRMSGVTLIQDGAISTQKLAAASITGDKVVANTLTGDKIVANSITGDKIAANTITANNIAAGSISADKLMVGASPNLLTDPGWTNGLQFWGTSNASVDFNGKSIVGSNEKVLTLVASTNSDAVIDSNPRPCLGGTWYMASVYSINASATGMYLGMYFLDGANNVVSYQTVPISVGGNPDYAFIAAYTRVYLKVQAPGSAIKVVLRIGINAGSMNSGGFSYHPQIEECFSNQAGPGPWGAAINTIIGPGSISTGSLSAISANLGSITAGSLNINNRFIVYGDGTTVIQTGTSGQRSILSAGQFLAYDGNNTLRMRAGVW